MIESFIASIVSAAFKKAVAASAIQSLSTAYSIYTTFEDIADICDCVDSTSDSSDLGVCGVRVASGYLGEAAVDHLLQIGSDSFTVEQTSSGIYVASRVLPTFSLSPGSLPSGVFRGGAGSFSQGGGGRGFSSGGRGSFRSGG